MADIVIVSPNWDRSLTILCNSWEGICRDKQFFIFLRTLLHLHCHTVVRLWDLKMLLLDVHQLHLVLRDPLLVTGLEGELESVRRVSLGGDLYDVVLGGAPQHLAHAVHVHTKREASAVRR